MAHIFKMKNLEKLKKLKTNSRSCNTASLLFIFETESCYVTMADAEIRGVHHQVNLLAIFRICICVSKVMCFRTKGMAQLIK